MLEIKDNDFYRLVSFVQKNYGIDLSKKRQLISGRLTGTVTRMGFTSFEDYIDHLLTEQHPQDIEIMLNKLTTNYTYFLREISHFDFFKDTILPELMQRKKDHSLNIWSAACSSGEEPYTISMLIKETLGNQAPHWDTRVLATDISTNVLRTAMKAEYDELSLKDVSPEWKAKYFRPTGKHGVYTVSPELRSNVIFRSFNLMDPITFRVKFDVIFCRNVMIYFDQPTKDALVNRFYKVTSPGGYLLIGHSENLNKATTPYTYVDAATFRKEK